MRIINNQEELKNLAINFFRQNKDLKESDFAITDNFIKDFREYYSLPKSIIKKIRGFCNPITGEILKTNKIKRING